MTNLVEGQALFESVLEAPNDIAPRLVFTDWVQDQNHDFTAERLRADDPLMASIATVLKNHPNLIGEGYPTNILARKRYRLTNIQLFFSRVDILASLSEFRAVLEWLSAQPRVTTFGGNITTHWMKTVFEGHTKSYCCNGTMMAAVIHSGILFRLTPDCSMLAAVTKRLVNPRTGRPLRMSGALTDEDCTP